jgi:hypothetical protein
MAKMLVSYLYASLSFTPYSIVEPVNFTRIEMAYAALATKNYLVLENLIESFADNIKFLLSSTISLLDEVAVEMVSKHYKLTETEVNELVIKCVSTNNFSLRPEAVQTKQQKILQILADQYSKSIKVFTEEPTVEVIVKPLHTLSNATNPSIVDVILSRTFTKDFSEEYMRKLYSFLLQLDAIANEMLTYMALSISKGDPIKIYLEEGEGAAYQITSNSIHIDSTFFNDKHFNLASSLIHEIGHNFYDKIFKNTALPINRKHLENLNISEPINIMHAINLLHQSNDPKLLSVINSFEEASKQPVNKAAELLGMDIKIMDKLQYVNEHTAYFKLNSIIDIFYLNFLSYASPKAPISHDMMVSVLNIYYDQEYNKVPEFIYVSQTVAVNFVLEQFLPQVVSELNLTESQIHFLMRISNYVNRGNHQYSDNLNTNLEFEKYIELIVRYSELKAAGIEDELLLSFSKLVEYHLAEASPLAQEEIQLHLTTCKNMTDILVPEGYCISDL